jgi:Predicted membrane protein
MDFSKSSFIAFIQQAFKYGLVGVVNTIVSLGTIFIGMKVIHCSYILSNIMGYSVGIACSFFFNKRWTFKSNGNAQIEMLIFLGISGVCYLIQLAGLVFLKEALHIKAEIAQVLAIAFYTMPNFLGNKFITFRNAARVS